MNELYHAGVGHDDDPPGRGSGRYGWGTGKNPGQHQFDVISEYDRMRKDGLSESEIAKILLGENARSTELRAELSIAKSEKRKLDRARAIKMYDACNHNMSEAARKLGMKNESSLRSLLDPIKAERADRYQNTADMLKKIVDERGMVDISKGTELYLNVPRYTLDVAVEILAKEGYLKSWANIKQLGTSHETSMKVLAKPGITHGDVQRNKLEIKPIQDFTPDEGKTWWTPEFPASLDSKRIYIRYNEDGGREKDGVIELRRGVEDISLGNSQYSQVRIAVDGTHYMKGMAMYADDIPKGYDVVYNTNKHRGTPMIGEKDHEVLKRMKINKETGEVDRDNPFGALIKSPTDRDGVVTAGGQRHYIDKDGNEKLSPINKLRDEGDWDSWSRTISSQFLAKQPLKLINQQIDLSVASKREELDQIMKLTNPVVKKKLLDEFASSCDSNAADLSTKGFKKQAFQVILPITDMKDNECYAPQYDDGDTLALVRFPHGGTFEIPILKVNNRQPTAKKVMQNATDAIGINVNVADRLSGADFDGDTVVAIPVASNRLAIKSTNPLKALEGFDPKELYKLPDDAPQMKPKTKQTEMGKVSNLITDMTVGGATYNEIGKAVRHSMVVIDAEKHHLDYEKSYKDNDIYELKKAYQGVNDKGQVKGASTILSRAKSEAHINDRKEITDVKKMTPEELARWNEGKKVYRDTGKTKRKQITNVKDMTPEELKLYQAGKKVYRDSNELKTIKVSQMDTVDDAMELVRDPSNQKEVVYANYANNLKAMANEARREYRSIKPIPVSQDAKKTYAEEVEELNRKLRIAQLNAPKERTAQAMANAEMAIKKKSNPDMDFEHQKREEARSLQAARAKVGAKKERIDITVREWEAIQAGAISTAKLTEILANADSDKVKKLATPRTIDSKLSSAQMLLLKSMASSGMYTQKEIADRLGISASAVSSLLKSV